MKGILGGLIRGVGWELILLRVLRSLKGYNVAGNLLFFGFGALFRIEEVKDYEGIRYRDYFILE